MTSKTTNRRRWRRATLIAGSCASIIVAEWVVGWEVLSAPEPDGPAAAVDILQPMEVAHDAPRPLRPSHRSAPWPPFRISTPEAEGMDGARLAAAYVTAAEIPHIYSMLVVRQGALVGETYFGEQTRETATWVASVGKSIVSALVGVAIEEGFLIDLDQRMIDYFPEYDLPELDPRKRQITIRHLITMTAGYPDDNNTEFFDAVNASSDWMRFCVVDWELETAPGESWNYSNASTHMISGILTKAAGMSLLELANSFIFGRMAQPIVNWPTDPQGYCWGIGQFKSTPLQLASFGQMVLDRGLWRGRPILDAAWLAASLAPITEAPDDSRMDRYHDRHYGYLWWRAEVAGHDVSFAQGHGGQAIVVVPELDLVVVTTAYDFGDDFSDVPWQTEGRILDLIAAEVIPAAD